MWAACKPARQLFRIQIAFQHNTFCSAAAASRVAKEIASSGFCSRRDAERLIAQGRVAVNGSYISSAALNVKPEDEIAVDGQVVERNQALQLFACHKLPGELVSHSDPKGRPLLFDRLAKMGLPKGLKPVVCSAVVLVRSIIIHL